MKFRFGAIIERFDFTNLNASSIVRVEFFMMYEMAIVADLETPAWQCINTFPPELRASSARQEMIPLLLKLAQFLGCI